MLFFFRTTHYCPIPTANIDTINAAFHTAVDPTQCSTQWHADDAAFRHPKHAAIQAANFDSQSAAVLSSIITTKQPAFNPAFNPAFSTTYVQTFRATHS